MAAEMKYIEQLERTERWFKRFEDLQQGTQCNQPSECLQDDVYAFFMNCYHLKDWIINDPALDHMRPKVEAFINDNECLKLCADLCNGCKHLRLTSSRSKQDPLFSGRHYRIEIGSKHGQTIQITYDVNTLSGTQDAYDVASQCMTAWRDFVKTEIAVNTS